MKQNRKLLLVIVCFLICLMPVLAVNPSICFAKETQNKTVRVAYALAPGYQEGGEGEYKTGYGYEYLQKIARINGWKYEYIYGSFNELLDKLQKGEVDLMGNLSYTEERAEKISYGTYEEGKESSYLYVNKKSKAINPQDYSTINGKKIGLCTGQIQEKELTEWCRQNDVKCNIVRFDYFEDCKNALNSGRIDALVESGIQLDDATDDWDAVLKFDASPFYFGVNKERPDLLKELNEAQGEILEENPFYNEKVQERYLKPVSLATSSLNIKGKRWLKENDHHIKFGYLKGFPPLCYEDEGGECKGVAADVLSAVEENYAAENIEFEAVAYSDYNTMFDALNSEEISLAWPAYDDYWSAEQRGYSITDRVVDTSMMLVYDGKYTDDTVKKIGVINTGSLPKIYANIYYPKSDIHEYDSYDSAINAILKKEISSVLYVSTTYNVDVATNDVLQKLNMVVLPDNFGISFAVSPKDEALSSVLDKGISEFGRAGVNHSLIVNSAVNNDITLEDYFEQHPYIGVVIIVIILSLIAGIILLIVYKNMSIRVKSSQAEKVVYEKLSNSDALTGLYNRKMVFRKCRELLNEHPDDLFAMVHVDMKHFRLYNTFFGDEAGDKLLCDVADIFRAISDDYDYWAYGRIEADVFCLFFPYDEKKYRKHLTETMEYLKSYRTDFLIQPALGVYFVTDSEMPMEAMFTRATLAAKEVRPATPYATVIYDEKLETELKEKQQIINDMQTAVDREQFKVYLQPKYSLRNNKMVGAEALVRWQHPTRGLVSPGKFIPVFESNGFITTLDRYMWEHVCRLISKWKKECRPIVPISVNVSRLSMFGTSTVDFLKELVRKYDIDPRYLELELTESAYMDNPEEIKAHMSALRSAGFTILLDDFGSGYSSLNTLRELPVDILKLDMKFLSESQKDKRGAAVLSSVIRMSKLLDLPIVAEGVEKSGQANYLRDIGCEYVQGFLFAKPMQTSEYEKLLEKGDACQENRTPESMSHVVDMLVDQDTVANSISEAFPSALAFVEYENGEMKVLRANNKFLRQFGLVEDYRPASAIIKEKMDSHTHKVLIESIEDAVKQKRTVSFMVKWPGDNGIEKLMCCVDYEGTIDLTDYLMLTLINMDRARE